MNEKIIEDLNVGRTKWANRKRTDAVEKYDAAIKAVEAVAFDLLPSTVKDLCGMRNPKMLGTGILNPEWVVETLASPYFGYAESKRK